VSAPVGHLDLAATFCAAAGIPVPDYVDGKCLPRDDAEAAAQSRETMLTVWDSEHGPVNMHLQSLYRRDGWLCTAYEASALYEGNEGELYDMNEDPQQRVNLWDRATDVRDELLEQLRSEAPPPREPRLPRRAPV